jgi:hypothetical protein
MTWHNESAERTEVLPAEIGGELRRVLTREWFTAPILHDRFCTGQKFERDFSPSATRRCSKLKIENPSAARQI